MAKYRQFFYLTTRIYSILYILYTIVWIIKKQYQFILQKRQFNTLTRLLLTAIYPHISRVDPDRTSQESVHLKTFVLLSKDSFNFNVVPNELVNLHLWLCHAYKKQVFSHGFNILDM